MKFSSRLFILFLFTIAMTGNLHAQITSPPENFYVIKAREDLHFDSIRAIIGSDSLNKRDDYGEYNMWKNYWEPLVYPHGDFMVAYNAMNQLANTRMSNPAPQQTFSNNWGELGPFTQPSENISGQIGGTGRLQFITFDPQNSNNIFTGGPRCGLFHSADGGNTWQNGGTDFLPLVSVAHCAIDPFNSSTWFIATGDGEGLGTPQFNGSSYPIDQVHIASI